MVGKINEITEVRTCIPCRTDINRGVRLPILEAEGPHGVGHGVGLDGVGHGVGLDGVNLESVGQDGVGLAAAAAGPGDDHAMVEEEGLAAGAETLGNPL